MADAPSSDSDRTVPQPGPLDQRAETLAFRPPPGAGSEEAPTCPAAPEPPAPALPAVPGYVVTREIGRGGMGVVYAARDPQFERELAIKVMHPGQSADQFVVEAKVTAGLPHPGVPPVYALGALPDGRPFLAMKLVEGRTLAQELNGAGRADLPRLLDHFQRVCLTVGFAHARGVVHRDLKPSNVMVGAYGEVQVMDWGLATRPAHERPTVSDEPTEPARGRTAATSGGRVRGTPAYMSPEQARGEPADDRSDVFALGGILAAVLTGAPPFAGDTVADTVRRAARADLAECFARLGACGADADLVAVARRCLAPHPADRYATGARPWRRPWPGTGPAWTTGASAPSATGPRPRPGRPRRRTPGAKRRPWAGAERAHAAEQRKRRGAQCAAAVTALVLVGALGGFAWWRDKQRTSASERADARAGAERLRIEADGAAVAARLAGERDAEARHKADQARAGVRSGLALATDLHPVQVQTGGGGAGAGGGAGRGAAHRSCSPGSSRARADLAFVERLDDIRFRKWAWVAERGGRGTFNTKRAPAEYRRAFADHGLDLAGLAPPEAARRIAAAAVRAELVTAVDDWALHEPDVALRDRLLGVARAADPGPWSDRLRDPGLWGDRAALAKLAADTDPARTAATGLSALAELMRRNNLDPAPLLSAARTKHPGDFELAFALGQWRVADRSGRQIGPYEAARALRPDNPTVWRNLGVALGWRGDLDGEIAACRELVRLVPNDATAHNNLGAALSDKGDLPGALAAGQEAVRLDPEYAAAHDTIGLTRARMNDLAGAIASFREAVRADPQFARGHNNLGVALKAKGDLVGAIAAYREAVRADPDYAVAHSNLGVALHIQGDLDGAIAAFRTAVRLNPKYALAHTTLGMALEGKNDSAGAAAAYKEAIRADPRYALAHSNLGALYLRQQRYPEAIDCARAALKDDPEYPEALATLGLALLKTGDVPNARAALTRAAKLNPKQYGPLLAQLPSPPVAPAPHEK
ncbi:tetratricopeptide repeat protein [Frigoriglobus tundricola]|uniref:Protein kinase domain-containing protein n=1 Tax=Frigoriglobus tundricola TaxID=2774151 RepID=A0A6M5YND5_9BACT|nr:tetratricopeptide repeat protein [Frigoriglobus tundricola]QJW95485.1 hypothetical protein FTUN_3034 [Frigoriglobus tundricola]